MLTPADLLQARPRLRNQGSFLQTVLELRRRHDARRFDSMCLEMSFTMLDKDGKEVAWKRAWVLCDGVLLTSNAPGALL